MVLSLFGVKLNECGWFYYFKPLIGGFVLRLHCPTHYLQWALKTNGFWAKGNPFHF